MEQKFTKITNKAEWQDLLNKVLFKTLFHNIEWEGFLESQFKWLKFERYNYQNQALLSFARVGEKLVSHPFCEYGGPLPLVDKINGEEFKKDLFSELKNPIKISFHPRLLDYFNETRPGLVSLNQRETYFYENIGDLDRLWQRMDRNRHRSIKTAEEQNFLIEECRSIEDLRKLHHFYAKDMKKHKTIPYPFSFFEYFWNSHQAKILLVKKEKQIIGGNIFLSYNKILHSFLCGFEEKFKKSGVHSLVIWEAIKIGRTEGFQQFDFGATRKDSSIGEFKERWGAQSYPIYELKNYFGESSLRKSKLRNIFSLLPPFLIKKLSPYLLKYKL